MYLHVPVKKGSYSEERQGISLIYQCRLTFAICAYGESPYLEECIQSCRNQTVAADILLATSTPNEHIKKLCKKYKIPMYVNTGESGITQDWNFAYAQCGTEYITIAHQDDIYCREYVESVLNRIKDSRQPLIAFTDYFEIRKGKLVKSSSLLRIKRLMLLPFCFKCFDRSRFIRRRVLSFGTPICCPSVTFVRGNLPDKVFLDGYRASEDWQAWERISRQKGDFLYCRKPLMCHRIHQESETTKLVVNNIRRKEDLEMFEKFWPKPIAVILAGLYAKSEKSNEL